VKTLTVTKAAKTFHSCVKIVYHKHETFEFVEKGIRCAQLVPVNGASCNTHELADDLAEAELSAKDRHALASAVLKGRKHLRPLKNPWA
jgi:hypothetical protein